MARPEQALWQAMRRGMLLPRDVAHRVETGATAQGIPDVHLLLDIGLVDGARRSVEIWVELKAPRHLAVDLSWGQVHQLTRLARAHSGAILAGTRTHLHVWPGRAAREVAEGGIRTPGGRVFLRRAPGTWGKVRAYLIEIARGEHG